MNILTLVLLTAFAILTGANPVPNNASIIPRSPPQVPAHERRGIAFNNADFVHYFAVEGTHATWCYNWDSWSPRTDAWYPFIPMLHSLRPDHTGPWMGRVEQAARDAGDGPTHLLGFNEPDICQPGAGGSCISVGDAVAGWKTHVQPLKTLKDKMYLGSPSVSNAAASGSTGLGWLANFIRACSGCTIDFITIHWYDRADNVGYFKKHIEDARKVAQGRPIWITEFKAEGTDEQVKRFLDEVIPWMDQSSDIHRYAYFMARSGPGMLINDAQNGMSDLGAYYNFHHRR
ncbi:glycoside hydrolase family 128 protein [Cucurbitaria berberidis CBS 394.84]|uniref:Glycoside hydrolase family 128 protein n=1 Tax=Cucurbitaria berberidis CBS 394.84 TaxID=1168544 RepID=A0A9P4G9K3_9PLEO|nr:glycoside hydrolase family 128 protein [Cucurbitaria berberidis CBS 394.84]KAF1841530.1 glycoside hydrolase family 128 protein [Cucurbitaria berberidis CBS 394.84]